MSLPPQDLQRWLCGEHEATIKERAKRLSFIVKELGPAEGIQLFHGAELNKEFFEEARWCFVNGQYVGCLLLCQCFLEQSLSSLLAQAGVSDRMSDKRLEMAGFCELIDTACEIGVITSKEAADFHWVRETRVQYVHPKPVFSKNHIAHRYLQEGKMPKEVYESDARRAILIVLRLIRRPPFRV